MTTMVKSKYRIAKMEVETFELKDTDYTNLQPKTVEVTLDLSPEGNHKASRLQLLVENTTLDVTYPLLMDLKKSFNKYVPCLFELPIGRVLTGDSARELYLKLEHVIKKYKISLTILK